MEMADGPMRTRRRRNAVIAAGAAAILVVALVGAVAWRPSSGSSENKLVVTAGSGRRAPTFDVPNVRPEQGRVVLEQLRGKPVVLNFWASWCAPCKSEMPAFQAVHQQVGDRIAFVGIDHQDGKSGALALLAETGVTYPSGYDPEGKVAKAYGLFGLPVTVFISPDGHQLASRQGEMSRKELEDTIRRLFP